ncbi:MAG TPA: MerR family transcriptional regulator [Streptosporangiaceae bacterium]|nr:MerR family transcriptional regulator [Streptosporangiaceae bacterium]
MNSSFARAYLGIGEVLVKLRSEFPDISVSKIRFLESEGLISPARSPSGYRRFSPADVDQLRFILTAQRDEYLPLRVIKERLAHREEPSRRRPAEMVTQRELLDSAGIDEKQLAELETHGLIKRSGRLYGSEALDVATAAAALAGYGLQARNLRMVSTAADRDLLLIEQLVGPTLRQRGPEVRESATRTAREIAMLLLRLHRSMLEAGLADAGLAGDGLGGGEGGGAGGGRAGGSRAGGSRAGGSLANGELDDTSQAIKGASA